MKRNLFVMVIVVDFPLALVLFFFPSSSALFQSLLYEACGRTVNPVDGAVGLLSRGMWNLCQLAVETALAGGDLTPIADIANTGLSDAFGTEESAVETLYRPSVPSMKENQLSDPSLTLSLAPKLSNDMSAALKRPVPWRVNHSMDLTTSFKSEDSEMTSLGSTGKDRKLLNLFV